MYRVLPNLPSSTVYLVGGPDDIHQRIYDFLEEKYRYTVVWVHGDTPSQTSVNAAKMQEAADTAILVAPNIASIGFRVSGVAGANGWPVLVSTGKALSAEIEEYITNDPQGQQIQTLYVVGCNNAVGDRLAGTLQGLGKTTSVIYNNGRFDMARNISEEFYPSPSGIVVASAFSTFDAMNASLIAAHYDAPLLITGFGYTSTPTYEYLRDHNATTTYGYMVGAENLIHPNIKKFIGQYGVSY